MPEPITQTGNDPTSGLYAIFVHRTLKPPDLEDAEGLEQEDADGLDKAPPPKKPPSQETIDKLVGELTYLSDLLIEEDGWSGVAFVFLDYGWVDLLRDMAQAKDVQASEFTERLLSAAQARERIALVRQALEDRSKPKSGPSRVKLVIGHDLDKFLRVVAEHDATDGQGNRLWRFLAGGQPDLLYDAPKVIESVIRLANSRDAVPVLRFDDDVIFYGARRSKDEADRTAVVLKTRANIRRLCRHFVKQRARPDVSGLMFSGSYLDPSVEANWWENAYECVNSFALRSVQLADLPKAECDLRKKRGEMEGAKADAILEAVSVSLDPETVQAFFKGMHKYGANPFEQPISGAGEFFSYGLISDLPPYANMQQLVMWIDDYLKYSLHKALGHLPNLPPADIRINGAWFHQLRHELKDLHLLTVKNYLSKYMPRVVLGCIAHAWLSPGSDVRRENRYVTYFIDGAKQPLDKQSKAKLRDELWTQAIKRANELVKYFDEFKNTFLTLFVDGVANSLFAEFGMLGGFAPDGMRAAVRHAVKMPDELVLPTSERAFKDAVRQLIEDFVEYIEFVRFWKHFVYAVRWEIRHNRRSAERFLIPDDVVKAAALQTPTPASDPEVQRWMKVSKHIAELILSSDAPPSETINKKVLYEAERVLGELRNLPPSDRKNRIAQVKEILFSEHFPETTGKKVSDDQELEMKESLQKILGDEKIASNITEFVLRSYRPPSEATHQEVLDEAERFLSNLPVTDKESRIAEVKEILIKYSPESKADKKGSEEQQLDLPKHPWMAILEDEKVAEEIAGLRLILQLVIGEVQRVFDGRSDLSAIQKESRIAQVKENLLDYFPESRRGQ